MSDFEYDNYFSRNPNPTEKAVISIKREYADKILAGDKLYEFRKTIFTRPINNIILYVTKPIGMLVGEIVVGWVFRFSPEDTWSDLDNTMDEVAGISEEDFFKYCKGHNFIYSIAIKEVIAYETPLDPKEVYPNWKVPQSYIYVNKE